MPGGGGPGADLLSAALGRTGRRVYGGQSHHRLRAARELSDVVVTWRHKGPKNNVAGALHQLYFAFLLPSYRHSKWQKVFLDKKVPTAYYCNPEILGLLISRFHNALFMFGTKFGTRFGTRFGPHS